MTTTLKTSIYRTALIFLFCLLVRTAFSQSSGIKLSSSGIDFGRIGPIAYPARTIEFENTGTNKLAILLIDKGSNVRVIFERKFYQPGEKGIISVYYDPRDLGPFQEDMLIYTNLSNQPETVHLKGTCIDIQECFPNKANLNLRKILVINRKNQKPVPKATVRFIHNHNDNNPVEFTMDVNGEAVKELPIGLYNVSTVPPGYEKYKNEFFLPKSQPNVLIELDPQEGEQENVSPVTTHQDSSSTPRALSADLPENKYAANNIVLLLDVSTSMKNQGKFSLLQQSVNNLVMILRPIDQVSVITYANEAKVALPGLPGNEKERITGIVQDLKPNGSTQGVKGLNMAYEMAGKHYIEKGNNQIILATDGEFSEKNVSDEFYQKLISGYAQKGIKLSILGFGVNPTAIDRMKKMASFGQGNFILVPTEAYAKTILIEEIKTMSFMR